MTNKSYSVTMSKEQKELGPFESILALVGGFTGLVFGYDIGEWVGAVIGAVVLWGIGRWVGAVADALVKFLVLVGFLLLNRFVRLLAWDIIQVIFSGV